MKNYDKRRKQFEGCIVAALETGAKLRVPGPSGEGSDPIGRIIATIEAESARIQAHDPSAMDAALASQGVALDTLFTQLASWAVTGGYVSHDMLRLALKAQSQSRTTLKSLASPTTPTGEGRAHTQPMPAPLRGDLAQKQNSSEQTIGNGNL